MWYYLMDSKNLKVYLGSFLPAAIRGWNKIILILFDDSAAVLPYRGLFFALGGGQRE